jgi:hypothetical protein
MVAWIRKKFNFKWLLLAIPILLLSVVVFAGVDDTAFTVEASRVDGQGCIADETTPDSVGEGDIGICRMSLNRNQYIQIRDDSTEISADVATANGGAIAVTIDALNVLGLSYVFDGTDWAPLGADSNGDLTVNQTTSVPGYTRIQDNNSTDLVNATSNALDINIAGQTLTAVVISATSAANTLANPIFTQISQDGTNAVATAYPLPISATVAQNTVTNPIFTQVSATNAANLVSNPIWAQISVDGTNAMSGSNPLVVSKDTSANAANNAIFFQMSDGTNAMFDNTSYPGYIRNQDGDSTVLTDVVDAGSDNMANTLNGPVSHCWQYGWDGSAWDRVTATSGAADVYIKGPLGTAGAAASVSTAPASDAYYMVSKTAAANAANNPIHTQITTDGTNAMDATHPLVISATAAANATANRIWVTSNTDQVAGTATNVNGGAKDAGTQTVTLATDDPAVVALELLDNAYTAGTTSLRTEEIDPLDQKFVFTTLVDETDYAETAPPHTEYYYIDNNGYRYNSFQLELDSDNGTVTATVECSIQSGVAQASASYVDITQDAFGVASLQSAAAPATDMWIDNDQKLAGCRFIRLKVIFNTGAANDDGDATVFHSKHY